MIFIITGTNQGAMEYANELAKTSHLNEFQIIDVKDTLIKDFDLFYDEHISEVKAHVEKEWAKFLELISSAKNLIFVGTEMGCGVVPLHKKDRLFCEFNGRINCLLAKESDQVIRMVCGIPMVIKSGDEALK